MHVNSETVIFIHIPKAAGTTFYQVLNHQYKAQHIQYIKEGMSKQRSIDAFRKLPEEKKTRLRCIRGHMPFGLHQWLPKPATYITILRNPVNRVLSQYYYIRRTPVHPLHSELIEKNVSLEAYVRMMSDINTTNLQTRWLAGYVDFDSVMPPYEDLPADALDLAKENIENFFSVCGLTERFDESLLLMRRIHGWKNVYYIRRNVGKRRSSKEQPSTATLRLIEKHEEKDLELCEYASKRLTETLNAHCIDDEQVRQFRTLNRLLGFPVWACNTAYRILRTKIHTSLKNPE